MDGGILNKKGKFFIISVGLLVISIIYTLLVKFVDVKSIGPWDSSVGFSTLNKAVYQMIGVNMVWYDITKFLGYASMLIAGVYALLGLKDLIETKSIKKVNRKIIILGVFYVAVLLTYVFFEKVIINYRPTLIEGELEASFPSSHTLLSLCICGSSIILTKYFIKNVDLRKKINFLTYVLMFSILFGRIISGVHWASDIIGGVIISLFLLSSFYTALLVDDSMAKKKR